MKGCGQLRVCEQCGELLHKIKEMTWCSICRKWFCNDCHKNDHVWQCQQSS